MPQFHDVRGHGSVDANRRQFSHGLWLSQDGRGFDDEELAQPLP